MDPLVSVIIATRNRCQLLPRALDSVLKQTYGNIEVIVVDDASEDLTGKVAEDYRGKFRSFRYIRNPAPYDGARSRNIGIGASSGGYIAFLDDDDEWLPRKIETQLKFLEEHRDVAAVSCSYIQDIRGKSIKVRKLGSFTFGDMLWDNFLGSFSFVMVRSDVLRAVGPIDESITGADDWDLWLRVSRGHKIGSVDDPLAVYHWHSGNISRWTDKLVSRYAVVYRRYSGLMTEECRRYHVRRLAANGARATAGGFGRIGAFLDALKRYDRRFSDDPFFNIYALASLCLEGILPVSALVRMRNAPKGSDHVELENLYRNIHRA